MDHFYQDVLLYKCPTCKGFWFPESRFGQVKNIGFEGLKDVDTPSQQNVKDLDSAGSSLCPQCQTLLTGFTYAYSSGIQLYHCKNCNGIWAGQAQMLAISQVLNNYKESLEEARLKALPLLLKVKEDLEKKEEFAHKRSKNATILGRLLSKFKF
jgi:Zn-finger nucleic acid-binding protein